MPAYRNSVLASKTLDLEAVEGQSAMEIAEAGLFDGIMMGICMNPGCNYTTEVEPDAEEGWCEVCNTGSVCSAAILIDVI